MKIVCLTCLLMLDSAKFEPRRRMCKLCRNKYKKAYRARNHADVLYREQGYRLKMGSTPEKYLISRYRNMVKRTKYSKTDRHYQYYVGVKVIFSLEEFICWGLAQKEFIRLFSKWEASGKVYKLAPSVDRIDSDLHYSFDNIQWLTRAENSLKAIDLRRGQKNAFTYR